MKILFCLTGWMKEYKGNTEYDPIIGGGSWVRKHGDGCEIHNFSTYYQRANSCGLIIDDIDIDENGEVEVCCGYVMTHGQIHIEKLGAGYNDEYINGVLVVWLATHPTEGGIRIVGWYKDATVYRWIDRIEENDFDEEEDLNETIEYESQGDYGENLPFNVVALATNCTLLPPEDRIFRIPRATSNEAGIGQSQVWYALGNKNVELVERVKQYFANYEKERAQEKR